MRGEKPNLKNLNASVVNTSILILCLLAAVSQKGKIFGSSYKDLFSKNEEIEIQAPDIKILNQAGFDQSSVNQIKEGLWSLKSDKDSIQGYALNSIPFTRGLYGFAGPVPMFIFLNKDSIIASVQLLENDETPEFIESVHEEGILNQWNGVHSNNIYDFEADAISGASITCFAINKGIQRSVCSFSRIETSDPVNYFGTKTILALLALLSGVVVSFWKAKKKSLRNVQLLINLLVLGFYCGQFISLKSLLGFVQNGMNIYQSLVFLIMLILTLVIPLFFKKNAYYCTWVCPYGAAQELMGKLSKKKIRFRPIVRKYLGNLRSILTMGLLFSLWLRISFDMINYEPFSAFLFEHASVPILIIAISGLILAIFIPLPFCRYACPTGELLKWTQNLK